MEKDYMFVFKTKDIYWELDTEEFDSEVSPYDMSLKERLVL